MIDRPHPSPWLAIPAHDYEAHMRAVGQSGALRALFAKGRDAIALPTGKTLVASCFRRATV